MYVPCINPLRLGLLGLLLTSCQSRDQREQPRPRAERHLTEPGFVAPFERDLKPHTDASQAIPDWLLGPLPEDAEIRHYGPLGLCDNLEEILVLNGVSKLPTPACMTRVGRAARSDLERIWRTMPLEELVHSKPCQPTIGDMEMGYSQIALFGRGHSSFFGFIGGTCTPPQIGQWIAAVYALELKPVPYAQTGWAHVDLRQLHVEATIPDLSGAVEFLLTSKLPTIANYLQPTPSPRLVPPYNRFVWLVFDVRADGGLDEVRGVPETHDGRSLLMQARAWSWPKSTKAYKATVEYEATLRCGDEPCDAF